MANAASERLGDMGLNISDVLRQYNLRRAQEPVQLEARILPEPKLNFFADKEAELNDGSWPVMFEGSGIKFNK